MLDYDPQYEDWSETRELVIQIYDVCREICKHLSQTHGAIMGGTIY